MSEEPRRHLWEADVVRVLAVIGVVVIHTSAWPPRQGLGQPVYDAIDLLARFSVPAFVMLSGFLLQFGDSRVKPKYLSKRLRRSLIPFVCWAPVYVVADIVMNHALGANWPSVRDFFLWGAGHLYFLPLIAQFYVVYLLWPRSGKGIAAMAVAGMAVQLILCLWRLTADLHFGPAEFSAWHGYQICVFWIGYFSAGIALGKWARNGSGLPRWLFWPALATAIYGAVALVHEGHTNYMYPGDAAGTGAFLRPTMIPYAVGLTIVLLIAGKGVTAAGTRFKGFVQTAAERSLGIYIIHPLVLFYPGRALIAGMMSSFFPLSLCAYVMFVVVTFVLSYYIMGWLQRTPLRHTLA